MTQRAFQIVALLSIAGSLACGSGLRPVNPPSFIRPERVAFTCVRMNKANEPVPVPLEQCSPCKGHTGEHSLYAFVTQSARGELAAVNLKSRLVIDTQTTVPGYTFVPVGEAPSAIAVPSLDPTHTYVVNVESSDLRVLDTERLLSTRGVTTATLAVIPLGRMLGGTTWEHAEPVDMILSTDEQRLVIAAPRLHGLIVIEVSDVERMLAGEIAASEVPQTIVALSGLSASATLITATGSDRYSESCGVLAPHPSQPVPVREFEVTSQDAMPVALTLDAEQNRVLVADAALPVIHAIDLTTLNDVRVEGRPLFVTGVPTLDVVISPPVPVSHGDAAMERYIYAIDADHRGVLVMNDRGVMQSVNATGTLDRIDFGGSGALSLEVMEPGYRQCAPETALIGPGMLRGVFLAASMIDGSIRVADVYDEHAQARCTPIATTGEPVACTAADPCAVIHRHRARIASIPTSPRPCVAPTVTTGIDTNVSLTASPPPDPAPDPTDPAPEPPERVSTPNLVAMPDCGDKTPALELIKENPMTTAIEQSIECAVVEPGNRAPLVCVDADPWAMGSESWFATWEGETTLVGTGKLNTDTDFETDAMNFCAAGVVGATSPEFQLEIIVETASQELRTLYSDRKDIDCTLFDAKRPDGTRQRLTLPITGALVNNTLTLGAPEDVPAGFSAGNVLDAARYCVAGMRFSFRIRSFNRYTVIGSRSGYVHAVIPGALGACVRDPAANPLLQGQAIPGERFENASIAFTIGEMKDAPSQDLRFNFPVAATVGFVSFDTDVNSSVELSWTVVSELRYSPIDTQLYAVDSSARGLLPIPLSPLPSRLSSDRAFR